MFKFFRALFFTLKETKKTYTTGKKEICPGFGIVKQRVYRKGNFQIKKHFLQKYSQGLLPHWKEKKIERPRAVKTFSFSKNFHLSSMYDTTFFSSFACKANPDKVDRFAKAIKKLLDFSYWENFVKKNLHKTEGRQKRIQKWIDDKNTSSLALFQVRGNLQLHYG
jgi:hypothetical protein